MCALCRIEVDNRVLCPACFERLYDAERLPSLISHQKDYGHAQLLLVALGLFLVFPLGPGAGPASVYFGAKGLAQRKAMGEPEGQVRTWLFSLLGVAETLAGFWLWMSFISAGVG
jgi:hypothetical protein